MQIKIGQSAPETARAGCVGGLLVCAYLKAAAVNTTLVTADFLAANVQVLVTLSRRGQVITMMNGNLQLLGTFFMRKNNFTSFITGETLVAPGVATEEIVQRTAWLKFESSIELRNGDVLTANLQFTNGALTANIDTAVSYIDFSFQPATVREKGVPVTRIDVVTTNATQQSFVNANGVKHIEFMNFDKTTWTNPVILSAGIQSDRLSYNASLVQLIGSENYKWPSNQPYQFGTTQFVPTVVRNLNMFPQMLTLYESGMSGVLLNNCVASLNFDGPQVAASMNWVGYTQLLAA